MVSPCDGIVGAGGTVRGAELFQAKGFPYRLEDLLIDPALVETYRDGTYVTLRLTSSMYHRFHAPHDATIERVTYVSGDTWNVNPIALKRVERLFCRNERAVLRLRLASGGHPLALVPVAAILVASIRLHFLDVVMNMNYRGAADIACSTRERRGRRPARPPPVPRDRRQHEDPDGPAPDGSALKRPGSRTRLPPFSM